MADSHLLQPDEGSALHHMTAAILYAVVSQQTTDGDVSGFVDTKLATEALSDCIAILRDAVPDDRTEADRQSTAAYAQARVLAASSALAEMRDRGERNPYLSLSAPPAGH